MHAKPCLAIRCLLIQGLSILAPSCSAPRPESRPSLGLAASALPNVGFALEGNLPLQTIGDYDASLSARITQQFLDDADFADDGFVTAGDWTQAELGLLAQRAIGERRAITLRLDFAWLRARGQPNIIDRAGDYFGVGLGIGLRTRIARNWFFGPELMAFLAWGEGEFVAVPQLVWGVYWSP